MAPTPVPAVVIIALFKAMTLIYGVGTTVADQTMFKHTAEGSLVNARRLNLSLDRLEG